jgi:co-chaperonin GroES (HSP10)
MLQALNDFVILKLFHRQAKGGIILADRTGTQLKDAYKYKHIAEVASVGDKVSKVKVGDKVAFTRPNFLVINPVFEEIGEPCGDSEGYDYTKIKEEDILGIIK